MVALPHTNETRDAERYKSFVTAGRAGTMSYLTRADEQGQFVRARVQTPFPWARTAIVCLASYHSAQPRSTDPAPADAGWIARYAWSSRIDRERGPPAERLSQGAAQAAEETGSAPARRVRRVRIARVCGHRACGGTGAGNGRGPGMDREEYLPYPSKAGVVCVSRRAAHIARGAAGAACADGCRSLRHMPALH